MGSHVIIRQKNHIDIRDAVLTKKYKVPRDIRDDFLIYENETAKGIYKGYTLPMNVDRMYNAFV